ncbi:hypothetical protein QBC44DRAFT_322082 [Cladorrhinum sp. PSN332]|nr:hypothetical protein QBC44DRAFT_322082 [Cladorrhinum sp. PSN332]
MKLRFPTAALEGKLLKCEAGNHSWTVGEVSPRLSNNQHSYKPKYQHFKMTITEFAVLNLAATPLTDEAKAALTKAQAVQDDWHRKFFPNSPLSTSKRASAWLQQVEDPSLIVTIAQWDTVRAHLDWVASDTNKTVVAELGGDCIDATKGFDVFHADADFLSDGVSGSLVENSVISVSRLYVPSEKKEAFTTKFDQVKHVLETYVSPGVARFGWREDLEEGAKEQEFVLACSWDSVEKHYAFAEAPGFDQFSQIQQFVVRSDIKHYRRFI